VGAGPRHAALLAALLAVAVCAHRLMEREREKERGVSRAWHISSFAVHALAARF